jgi:hypothetical protein
LKTICGRRWRQSPTAAAGGNVDRIWLGGIVYRGEMILRVKSVPSTAKSPEALFGGVARSS